MYISLTFDDGWKSQYENAMPILNRYQLNGTFYIITQYLYLSDDPNYMNYHQIIDLFKQGHEIGGHTVTHPNLTTNSNLAEIKQCQNDLNNFGIQAKSFAYPYGKYDEAVEHFVMSCGYNNARAVRGGYNERILNKFAIRGRSIKNGTTIEDIRMWIERAKDNFLVLIFHQVEAEPDVWGCKPELLEEICKLIRCSSLISLPLTQALDEFSLKT